MARPKKDSEEVLEVVEVKSKAIDNMVASGIPVESAHLQGPLMVPGIASEVHYNQSKFPGIQMTLIPPGLHCKARSRQWIVMSANVKGVVLK